MSAARDIEELKLQLQGEIRDEYNRHFANITFLLFLSYLWETVEHYMETSAVPLFQQTFQGIEYWGNRIITDSLCVVIGYYIAFRFKDRRLYWTKFLVIYLAMVFLGYGFAEHIESWYSNDWAPLWGDKTVALFDMWSFIHIASGTVSGSFVIWWNKKIPEALNKTA